MPEEFTLLLRAATRAPVTEAALVLSAMSVEHFVERDHDEWRLWVAPEQETYARQQLQAYWHENHAPGERPAPVEYVDSGWPGVVGYLGAIWMLPALQSYTLVDLRDAGNMHAGAVMDGELWRVITALTLHSDLAHITANSLFGVVFGLFVGRHLGSGLGWLLVLVCGAAANLVNALVQPDAFRSLGASTATFACLGLVPAFGWRRGFFRGQGWKRGFAPIFAAICVLAFTGFGSENVDVLAHLFGFAGGIGMGLAVARIDLAGISIADQQRAGFFAGLIIAIAWLFAMP